MNLQKRVRLSLFFERREPSLQLLAVRGQPLDVSVEGSHNLLEVSLERELDPRPLDVQVLNVFVSNNPFLVVPVRLVEVVLQLKEALLFRGSSGFCVEGVFEDEPAAAELAALFRCLNLTHMGRVPHRTAPPSRKYSMPLQKLLISAIGR